MKPSKKKLAAKKTALPPKPEQVWHHIISEKVLKAKPETLMRLDWYIQSMKRPAFGISTNFYEQLPKDMRELFDDTATPDA